MDELDARLKRARGDGAVSRSQGAVRMDVPGSAFGLAMRVGVELVVGVAVGVGIGYGLDLWLDTKPWLMILFFFLGSAAGLMNVMRVVTGQGMAAGYRKPDGPRDKPDPDGDAKGG